MQAREVKASAPGQRSNRVTRRLRHLSVLGAAVAVLVTGACGTSETPAVDGTTPAEAPTAAAAVFGDDAYLQNASAYVEAASDTWDAKAKTVELDLGEMYFKPKNLALEAGQPYVVKLVNKGKVKHEFTADKFFRSAAIRKVESEHSEVKAPYLSEIEVLAGKTVELFVIPVTTGTFETVCEIKGHKEAGMVGTITVTGTKPTAPAEVLGSVKKGPWLQDGAARIEAAAETWDAKAVKVPIEAGEDGGKMFFKPKDVTLKVNTPYVLELKNAGTLKHEFTSEGFFPTMAFRKAEDASGEYKAPLLREAEVKAGKQLDLYVIPTKVGTYKLVCEIPGHEKAGMFGTVTVTK